MTEPETPPPASPRDAETPPPDQPDANPESGSGSGSRLPRPQGCAEWTVVILGVVWVVLGVVFVIALVLRLSG